MGFACNTMKSNKTTTPRRLNLLIIYFEFSTYLKTFKRLIRALLPRARSI